VTFYGGCMKMCEDFAPNFGDKINGCGITTTHYLPLPIWPRNYWRKTTWLSSPPTSLAQYCSRRTVSSIKTTAISTELRWSKQNRRQGWTPRENTTSRIL
jgi:hypothetical protein